MRHTARMFVPLVALIVVFVDVYAAPAAPAPAAATPPPAAVAPVVDAAQPSLAVAPVVRTLGNLVLDGIPDIPADVAARASRYGDTRAASLYGWTPDGAGVLVATRFAETTQVHLVSAPGGARRQLTFYDEPVASASMDPAGDGGALYLRRDVGGREDWQIFRHDLASGRAVALTPSKTRASGPSWANAGGRFAFASSARNRTDNDIWLMEGDTPRLVSEREGEWAPWSWSPDDARLLLHNYVSVTTSSLHVYDLASGAVTPVDSPDAALAWRSATFLDDDTLLGVSDLGGEHSRLVRVDLATGERTSLTDDLAWDVEGLAISKDRRRFAFTVNEGGASVLYTGATSNLSRHTRVELPTGIVGGLAWDPAGKRLAVTLSTPTAPTDVYVVEGRKITRWTWSETGGLDPAGFVAPELVKVRSFDGLEVPFLIYRPRTSGPAPVLLRVHGGPEGQSRLGFDPFVQYLVNELGIAVILPNVRGSTGYGRAYVSADNGTKREDSVRDLGAVLDWIATRPELDAGHVGVMGGSYGGYMTLAALVHYGDRLRCGVDSVGISNFVTFLESTEPYRRDLRRVEYGDERDPEMRAFLHSISPLTNADRIVDPLFVVQGRNDPRVPVTEAEQIVATVRANGGEVWYLLANDEGHGLRRKSNREVFDQAVTLFLQAHLLGG